MKVLIDIPDNALMLTYQYVFDPKLDGAFSIVQGVLDSNALNDFRKEVHSDENV